MILSNLRQNSQILHTSRKAQIKSKMSNQILQRVHLFKMSMISMSPSKKNIWKMSLNNHRLSNSLLQYSRLNKNCHLYNQKKKQNKLQRQKNHQVITTHLQKIIIKTKFHVKMYLNNTKKQMSNQQLKIQDNQTKQRV